MLQQKKSMRVDVLGVGISPTYMTQAVSEILDWCSTDTKRYVCVTGVHGVMECQRDKNLLSIHNESGLTVPDGMPMVWAGRLQGFGSISRVYGPDLMAEICKASVQRNYSHFLYGGGPGIAPTLGERLEARYPRIQIVGTYTPPYRHLTAVEEDSLQQQVRELKPDLFWVGLSTPKQERFMAEHLERLDTKVMIGVGAAFDIHAGCARDAPDWIKKSGLQWLYRLCREPGRLWRRYLYNNPIFVYKFINQLLLNR
jgi:N-acetylglucosaminyldiphosphoundecaprenol N-acetyl-beta-D-mannosaminyltransferase